LRLLAYFEYPDRTAASRAEYAIKQLTPARKRALCEDGCGRSGMTVSDPVLLTEAIRGSDLIVSASYFFAAFLYFSP
jgi:hypothetical protein